MLIKKSNKKTRKNYTVRLSPDEFARIMQKAELYADGNFSQWCRYASATCVPRKRDLNKESK